MNEDDKIYDNFIKSISQNINRFNGRYNQQYNTSSISYHIQNLQTLCDIGYNFKEQHMNTITHFINNKVGNINSSDLINSIKKSTYYLITTQYNKFNIYNLLILLTQNRLKMTDFISVKDEFKFNSAFLHKILNIDHRNNYSGCSIMINFLNLLNQNLIDKNVNINEYTNSIISICKNNFDIIATKLNIKVTDDNLNKACIYHNDNTIKYILDSGIIATNKHLDSYITDGKTGHGYYSNNIHISEAIIDRLVESGGKLEYKHIVSLLSYKIELSNLDKYGIELENSFGKKCAEYEFYPYKSKLKNTVEILEEICRYNYNKYYYKDASILKLLKEYNTKYDIKPNITCLHNLCCNNGKTIKSIEYIVDKCGIKPDTKCIELICSNNKSQKIVSDAFIKEYKILLEQHEQLIEDNKKLVEDNKKLIDGSKDVKEKVDVKLKNEEDNIDGMLSGLFENKDIKNNNKKLIKFKDDIPSTFDIKEKIKIDKKVRTNLKLIKKSSNFMELRRKIFELVKNDKLFIGNKIKLSKELKSNLGFDRRYISFDDFDKFVYKVIQT
jgi:hypothetical protein